MPGAPLTKCALNRALLARQKLLRREPVSALALIEHLVGLQAQQARPPFVQLWSRIEGFRRQELLELIRNRSVVRATLMRTTLHQMSARDYLAFRSPLQPALTAAVRSILGDRMDGFEVADLVAAAREVYQSGPTTFTDLRARCMERFPTADERAMGYTVRTHLPLAVIPAEHEWGDRADPEFGLAEAWLGEAPAPDEDPSALVLRYLAAFGPATAGDFAAWSGLGGVAPVFLKLRDQLAVFRDERKRELFDLPEAPRPPEETPAPPRLIADFDNLVLGHADRSRVIADEHRRVVVTKNGQVLPTILVDGFVAGTWRTAVTRKTARLMITPFAALTSKVKEELAAEGEALLRFLDSDITHLQVGFGRSA